MTVNILFDQKRKPNVYPCTSYRYMQNYWSARYRCILPLEFHHMHDLNIIDIDDIASVDYFIYPVIMNEPYYVIREFINADHPHGFWNKLNPKVIEKINEGKGKIFVAMNAEPPTNHDLLNLMTSMEQNNENRIVFNINSSKYYKEDLFMTFPSWTEIFEFDRHILNNYTDTLATDNYNPLRITTGKRKYCLLNGRYIKHPAAVLLVSLLDKHDLLKDGYTFVDNKGETITEDYEFTKQYFMGHNRLKDLKLEPLKHKNDLHEGTLILSEAFHKSWFNIVVEAYYTNYMLDWAYVTEKTWRCLKRNIPFVLIGQKYTLQQLHTLGYKTFSPFIDETYDSLEDDVRIIAAVREIRKLCSMTHEELKELDEKCKPIYEHNHMNFKIRKQETSDYVRSLKAR